MRRPLMSGFCAHPTDDESHGRCHGYNTANPAKEFQPCPCPCHYPDEHYECANCGRTLSEAPLWPNEEEPGEMVYVHIDPKTGRAISEECLT